MDAIFLFIALVEFAITVLVLIKFFRLCSDVSRLKEAIDPDIDTCEESEFEHRFYLYLAAGEKERAKDLLFKECQKFWCCIPPRCKHGIPRGIYGKCCVLF